MAFEVGGKRGAVRPSMNVTPLVDVVLVLLIIFMVITPLLTKQFWLHVPKKDDKANVAPPSDALPPVVLAVRPDGTLQIGTEPVATSELQGKLKRIFAARHEHVLFFGADGKVPFGRAMEALDLARGAGAATIAVLTESPHL